MGGGLRLEVVCWGLSGTGPGSVRLAAHTLAPADHLGIPAVLTNAVRYADRSQHRVADVLDAAASCGPSTGAGWTAGNAGSRAGSR
ncbi:hypothetical protein ACN24M_01410 [Streptomyces microflavus]|uniref:hypothetical protein n=1 Tax=Streptomyces microflavus TaxID=1919 RepID=UPI003B21B0D2